MPKKMAIPIRMEKQLLVRLAKGARRTPLNQRELLRRTLRLRLREVIEAEAIRPASRLTTFNPWPRGALARAYRRANNGWDCIEAAATAAPGQPD